MGKPVPVQDHFVKCGGCKKQYDVAKVSLEARDKQKRNLYCPHCGYRVGKLN